MFPRICFGFLLAAAALPGHDMVHEGTAGPYRLTAYLNPHGRQPNVVDILVRTQTEGVEKLRLALTDVDTLSSAPAYSKTTAEPTAEDPMLFRASLDLPAQAFWRLHIAADGASGEGRMSIPVAGAAPAIGLTPLMAGALSVLLWAGTVGAVWLLWRFVGQRAIGRRPVFVAGLASLMLLALYRDWVSAAVYHPAIYRRLYQPLELRFEANEAGMLNVELHDPGRLEFRKLDDLAPDRGHLLHLYAWRMPELDRFYRLHPEMVEPGGFQMKLPEMPAGRYFVVADLVHESGLWEAPRGELVLEEAVTDRAFEGDDHAALGPPVSHARFGATTYELPDGNRIVWAMPERPLRTNDPLRLEFRLEDEEGNPADDVELYMGVPAQAAVLSHDLEVFSHVLPTGSIALASLDAFGGDPALEADRKTEQTRALPANVTFPYVFREPGRYRIVVQIKHGGKIESGFFDAEVLGDPGVR